MIRETNINRMLENKKKEGYWVLGLDSQADDEIDSLKVDRPFVLVLGNEGQGLRPLVQKNCDLMYRICLLYTSPSPRDLSTSRMPSSA